MPTFTRFLAPPANLDDFGRHLRAVWHKKLSRWFDKEIEQLSTQVPADRCQFYNPSKPGHIDNEVSVPVTWGGFPKVLSTLYTEKQAYTKAEELATFGETDAAGRTQEPFRDSAGKTLKVQYRMQDEYLEWRMQRDPRNGKVLKITFTCEGPEYWQALAKHDRTKLLKLYRALVHPAVVWQDLVFKTDVVWVKSEPTFHKGDYNPHNKWNTTRGIAHLTHWANTLRAEIETAGLATLLRPGVAGEKYLTDSARLICCSGYGDPNRSSDAQIGSCVNSLARLGAHISLESPIGVYIDQVDRNVITDARGKPIADLFRVVRGEAGVPGDPTRPSRILRMECSAPEGSDFVLGDLYLDGKPIVFGGQIASYIHMKLIATYFGPSDFSNDALPCPCMGWRQARNRDFLHPATVGTGAPESGYEPAFYPSEYPELSPGPPTGDGKGGRTRIPVRRAGY